MKQLTYTIALILTLSLNANAEPRDGGRSSDYNTKKQFVPEILELRGLVKSDGAHKKDCNVDIDLELIESETGESYSISEPGELKAMHCSKEKDLLVQMKAERTPKFLFWGGNLKVQSFEILEELESQPHHLTQSVVREPSFDRNGRR